MGRNSFGDLPDAAYDGRAEPGALAIMNHRSTETAPTRSAEPDLSSGEGVQHATICSMIDAQVRLSPTAAAVAWGDGTVSYRELDERANQLAHHLIGLGVGPDRLVGVCLPRSAELVVALLAIFKAGGAYVAVDPGNPRERLAFIFEDVQPAALITTQALHGTLPAPAGLAVVRLDADSAALARLSRSAPAERHSPDHLAYLIYTSGSTGTPKAVAMPHRVLVNLLRWQLENWTPPAAARTLQFTALTFDVAFQEIFSTLCAGGTLVMISEELRHDPPALLRLIRDLEVERIFLPFVALQQLARAFESQGVAPAHLRDVITAGEQLQISPQVRALFEQLPECTLHNQYGPAETHVVTALSLRGKPEKWPLLPPIGKPITGASIYILDEQRHPVPEGEPGEIHIGGDVLARGYFKREELTAQRFWPDPFSPDPAARLYQTGDLGSVLPDGNIQYLGRSDHQVKIRGVRVELGEVETALLEHPEIEHAVAAAREVAPGQHRLVAYFVPRGTSVPTRRELRQFLAGKLPEHSVPSAFVRLDTIPLTRTGKIDRLSLPIPANAREDDEIVSPETDLQKQIVAIWERCLNVQPLGIRDNFFDLGGDSLVAVQIAAEVEVKCQKTVPLAWTFQATTVEQLAAQLLDTPHAPDAESIIGINTEGTRRPFFCICGYFDIARYLGTDQPFYKVDLKRLEKIDDPRSAIERMAAQCIDEIRQVQPEGPYYLGGHSLGGVVAFEIARQLRGAGQEITLLALLDPDPPRPSSLGALRRTIGRPVSYLRHLLTLDAKQKREAIGASWLALRNRLRVRMAASRDFSAITREDKALALEGTYRPERYPGRITLFLAGDANASDQPLFDPRLDWGRLASGGADVHVIPGDHETLLREPNVRILGKLLRGHLETATSLAAGTFGLGVL